MSKKYLNTDFKTFDYAPVPSGQECKSTKFKNKATKQETNYTYLSKRQMKKLIKDKNENMPQSESEKFRPTYAGFFKFKKSKDVETVDLNIKEEKHTVEALLRARNNTFDVSYKPKFFHTVKGYIYTKEKDVFLAIEKFMLLPLLVIVLLLGVGVWQVIPNTPSISDVIEQWMPDLDENVNIKPEGEEVEVGKITFNGFSKWHIPAGTSKNIVVPLENPAVNECYFTFVVILNDTGETLYKSKMVAPGNGIYQIDLTRPLKAGEYDVTIHIITNQIETGALLNDYKMDVELIVD